MRLDEGLIHQQTLPSFHSVLVGRLLEQLNHHLGNVFAAGTLIAIEKQNDRRGNESACMLDGLCPLAGAIATTITTPSYYQYLLAEAA